jgi:hemoglobin/transferrin/lactoferrin receptor protein
MVTRHSRSILLTCTALALLGLATDASAQQATTTQQAEDSSTLQPIVLKGKTTRAPEGSIADTPLATETTQETILKRDIRDLDDLGNTVEPGVSWVDHSNSVNIRGLEEDRVLTTIDGIPIPYLSEGVWGATGGTNTYDFNSLSAVDILRGGDSSRAGSGALGGAVILRTLEPEDLIGEGKDWGAIVKGTYDGKDRSIGGSAAFAKKIQNTSVLFQGSYTRGNETKTGGDVGGFGAARTEADPEDYNTRNLLFKLRQELEGGHTIGFTGEHYKTNSDSNTMSTASAAYEPGSYITTEERQRDRLSLDYNYDAIAADSLIDSITATLYWQRVERLYGTMANRLTTPIGAYGRSTDNKENDYGFSGYANSSFDTGTLHHRLTFGGDFQFAKTEQFTTGIDSCAANAGDPIYDAICSNYHVNQSNSPDVNGYRGGVFIEDRIGFADSGFSLTPGLRFDWYKFDPKGSAGYEAVDGFTGVPDGQSDWAISPKLRAAWQVSPEVELFAQFSSAFKAPNVNQLYLTYVSTYYESIGNPDLDPEKSYGFEIGANLGDEDLGGRITAFTTKYKDFIDTTSTPTVEFPYGVTQFYNRANVRISGIEARGQKRFANGFNMHASIAYAYGEDTDTGDIITSVAPVKGIVGVGYERETWGTNLDWIASAAVDSDSDASTKPAGYGIVNLTGYWEPEKVKGLRVQAGVYNVFDKTYYDALEVKNINNATDLQSEAGRYFKVSLTQRF